MAGRFEGVSDLEWRLFEDIFPLAPPKRGRGMPHAPFRKINELPRSKLRGIKPPLARSYGPPVWRDILGAACTA